MWAFIATELMMFGGLFCSYAVYRWSYPGGFSAGSHHLDWVMGSVNTAVLLVSSLTVALAVHSAAIRHKKRLMAYLAATLVFGAAFLGIKAVEWSHDYHLGLIPGVAWHYYDTDLHPENAAELEQLQKDGVSPNSVKLFMTIYFFVTGLHGIHMIIGLGLMSYMLFLSSKGMFTDGNDQPIEISGLYWHLIDIIWIFLFPLLYLVNGIVLGG